MDSSQQAPQTYGRPFSKFQIRFRINGINGRKPRNIQRITWLGLCKRGLNSTRSSSLLLW